MPADERRKDYSDVMSNISARPQKKRGRPPKSRKDPQLKPTTGGMYGMQLVNADPNKTYVFADRSVKDWYAHYQAMGYVPEIKSEDGPELIAGSTAKPGEVFEAMGCVLMSIDKKKREAMDKAGRENVRNRMNEIRRASMARNIRRDYVRQFDDADIEFDINIPTREVENYG